MSDVLEANINYYLERILIWLSDNSLKINALKTKALKFEFSERVSSEINISIDGHSIC